MKELDAKIQKFLIVAGNCWAVINTNIAIATGNGCLKHSKDESMNHLSLGRPWVQSLFCRMRFVRRFATTGKVETRLHKNCLVQWQLGVSQISKCSLGHLLLVWMANFYPCN